MPAIPAPMMATLVVSGIGTVRGSVGRDSWKPPCSKRSGTCSSSTSEPRASGSSRAKNSGSSAAIASAGRGVPSASITAVANCVTVSESVTPARSGGSGTCEILDPNLSMTERSPVSWANTATSTPGSASRRLARNSSESDSTVRAASGAEAVVIVVSIGVHRRLGHRIVYSVGDKPTAGRDALTLRHMQRVQYGGHSRPVDRCAAGAAATALWVSPMRVRADVAPACAQVYAPW